MAIKPKTKPAVSAATKEAVSGRTVTLERGFTIQSGDGQWAKCSVSVTGPVDEVEEIREQVTELASTEVAAAMEQLQEFSFGEAATEDGSEADAEVEGDDEGEEEADITAEDIEAMERPELEELVTGNELELDLKKLSLIHI